MSPSISDLSSKTTRREKTLSTGEPSIGERPGKGNIRTAVEENSRIGADRMDTAIDLTQFAGDDPAAVLLVDLKSRSIVFANAVAEQLAPGVGLPADLDRWSDTAMLRDIDGKELSDSVHPLSAVAESRPVLGQAVSAERATELGRHREPLWVIALPLKGAPQLEGHALVVFLPLANRQGAQDVVSAAQAQADLRDRAILATGMSFTMADAQAPDMPLIWVNPAFTSTTGYSFEEAVGANCRFLQGRSTDPDAPKQMRAALDAGESISITLLNYRKDGTAFWNQVSMSPIHGANGDLTHYVGIQTDVTGRVLADEGRARALASEKAARKDAEEAQRIAELAQSQLSLLAEATSQLSSTLDVDELLACLATLVVPTLADWVIIATADRNREVLDIVVKHRDGRQDIVDAYTEHLESGFTSGSIIQRLFSGAPAQRIGDYSNLAHRPERESWVSDTRSLEVTDGLGAESVLFVPLPGRDHVGGVMVLLRDGNSPSHTDQDLSVAADLGRRAGLILDNARLYESEHRIAETLQRSLLPDLPEIDGVRAAARYWASETDAAVGGDFYELIPLSSGGIGLAIGDVVGHDVLAAAAMGHLRGLLRACAWDQPSQDDENSCRQEPADVLDRVDELIRGLSITTMASVAYACFEPRDGGSWLMSYSSAGHPPLIVREPDGSVVTLDDANGLLLGIESNPRTSAELEVPKGSTVVAYTDGLIERRKESLDIGLGWLMSTVADGPHDDPEALCDHIIGSLGGSNEDDVAILVLQL